MYGIDDFYLLMLGVVRMSKFGLVFAGGGGKGAYQIGVWKALQEYGIDQYITGVSGSSVGALNGALFVGGNYKEAEKIWLSISYEKLLPINQAKLFELFMLSGLSLFMPMFMLTGFIYKSISQGVFSREGIKEIIESSMDLNIICTSHINYYATCCRLPQYQAEYFKLNGCTSELITSILLASATLPMIYGVEKINEVGYLDGGLKDNMPIQPLYNEGYRDFIVVPLNRDDMNYTTRFSDINMIEISPRESLGNFIHGTLDFTREGAARRITQGYEDAISVLRAL